MEHAEEAVGEIFIAVGDSAVNLEVAEHAFDTVALPVEAPVPADRGFAVGSWRDHGPNAARFEIGADGVAVVTLVGDQGARRIAILNTGLSTERPLEAAAERIREASGVHVARIGRKKRREARKLAVCQPPEKSEALKGPEILS